MAAASSRTSARAEPAVSVIIPAFNEAEVLAATIAAIRLDALPFEVIVVDSGSSDGTAAIAAMFGARVVQNHRRQRANQLNLGAQHALASIILFLHADTILPSGALAGIVQALHRSDVIGGAFTRRYDSPSKILRATCVLAAMRNRLFGWHLGDQAMFVRSGAFFQLGGFREVDQFEDLDFSRRLRRFGKIVTLTPCVTSSSRRFDRDGAARTTCHDLGLTIRYLVQGLPEPRLPDNARQIAVS
ncbi:MAG: TIGR04283 family arsenosugar biosynthesis glycosyltransferase [Chthoniobacterales bacterium]